MEIGKAPMGSSYPLTFLNKPNFMKTLFEISTAPLSCMFVYIGLSLLDVYQDSVPASHCQSSTLHFTWSIDWSQ